MADPLQLNLKIAVFLSFVREKKNCVLLGQMPPLLGLTFLLGFWYQNILWYVRQFGKLWKAGVISQKKKFLASHMWPNQSKSGRSKYKPCKISPMKPFLVIFWIFPNTLRSFITLAEVLEAKKINFWSCPIWYSTVLIGTLNRVPFAGISRVNRWKKDQNLPFVF